MIKLVVFDFDGVFTDGKFYFGKYISPFKSYNAKDAYALTLLNNNNIKCGILTKDTVVSIEEAPHIFNRLNLHNIGHPGNKLEILDQWILQENITYEEVAYIGDDEPDIPILQKVGFSACPNDAIDTVKEISHYICSNLGGQGAVREFVECIVTERYKNYGNAYIRERKYSIDTNISTEKININNPTPMNTLHKNTNIELLDCTIRDGGYLNNWEFSDQEVIDCYTAVSHAGYDYFEIGFRANPALLPNKGKWSYCTDSDIDLVKSQYNGCKIVVMVNMGTFTIEDFQEQQHTNIDMVRVLIPRRTDEDGIITSKYNRYDLIKSKEICNDLIKLGYTVCMNFACADIISDEETSMIVEIFHNVKLKAIYWADTYGGFNSDNLPIQLSKFYSELTKYNSNIPFGFHSHNNNEDALPKALTAIQYGCTMIDTCIGGLGRGAGNLKSEQFISSYYGKNQNYIERITPIVSYYDKHLLSKASYNKGSIVCKGHPYYMISSVISLHPNYILEILSNCESSVEDDLKLIVLLDSYTCSKCLRNYDSKLIKKIIDNPQKYTI
jgi:4-hydroxy 2-oxovalerate aldolase